jgi:hypothetical protein
MFDRDAMPIYVILGFLLAVIILCVVMINKEYSDCETNGGSMVGTGEYYTTTTMVMSGKVMIPMTQTHEEMECRHKETGDVIEID